MRQRSALLAVTACCAALAAALAGCVSADGGGDSATEASASPAPVTSTGFQDSAGAGPSDGSTPAPTASAGTGAAGPSTATPAAGRCRSSDLRASIGPDHPGAGQENFAVILTNDSGHTCTVHGFPGVAFVDSVGDVITPDPERATAQDERAVPLPPGATAWSALVFSNPAISGVTTVVPAAVLVTPPGETQPITVPWTGGRVSNTGKAAVPRVSPFRSGDGG
ncbi:DUF4232 domain-containing protein [Streptomyces sp. ME18-1-4]|uniref:DUF4232 domain-containing protein n=1 Tax=Streptomyces sp. ME18-1-4 TaxID=3028685 RepID=UPI0029A37D20|nr:DUF4232 domain-containing protein [Streptomyces sp. ME18-1-4]MDX3245138.1 DUF4232 domain-containing protein [Streptomyces sp. ME18-1-4]